VLALASAGDSVGLLCRFSEVLGRFTFPDGVEDGALANSSQQENPKRVRTYQRAGNGSDVSHPGERWKDTSHAYEHGNQHSHNDGDFLHFIPFGYHDSTKLGFICHAPGATGLT
jgi:hypothetical protein